MAANQGPASRANRRLWVIAFALVVIAACLMVLVLRQRIPLGRVAESDAPPTAKGADLIPASVPQKSSGNLPAIARPRQTGAVLSEPVFADAPVANEPSAVSAIVASGPPSPDYGGLAPLTSLLPGDGTTTLIAGRVVLKGTPPVEIPIHPSDAFCGKSHIGPFTTRHYVVSTNGGLANVLVYIKSGLNGKKFPTPAETALLDQVGCEYQPYVLGVMASQKLRIKNSDPGLHNVHARPMASGNKEFNLAELAGKSITLSFPAQEIPIRFSCDIHPWMFAYVAVLEHPFFAVTDQDGNFSITNAPPGDYVLEAYHVKTHGNHTGETQGVSVTAGQTTTANFTIELPAQVSSSR